MDVPQTRSALMPRSSSARIAPMCAQPRALPVPRASPMRGLRRMFKILTRLRPNLRGTTSLGALEDRGDALTAADAHRHQRIALVGALELVERLHGEDGAGRADRVAEGHRAAVGIHLRRIEAEI